MSYGSGTVNGKTWFVTAPATNGVNIQLAACGIMTALLTASPSLSFWRFRTMSYTNFAMQSIMQSFDGTVAFGQTTNVKIIKSGDLIYFMYIVLQIPGIRACPASTGTCGSFGSYFPYALDSNNPCAQTDADYFASLDGGANKWLYDNYGCCGDYEEDCAAQACGAGGTACTQDPWAYWANAIGQLILRQVVLLIGTQTIDTLYSDYLFMWEELSGKPGKRLTEMIGKRFCREDLIADSQCTRTLYVPLPFYFTQTPGNALPIVSNVFSAVQLQVSFENLQNCIVVSGPDVTVVKCDGGGPITNADLLAAVDTTQVYLEMTERDRFAATNFEQLINTVQSLYIDNCCGQARVQLQYTLPVIELIWAVRRQCSAEYNNWFNYSGILGREPLVACELLFNNTQRVPMREASYFRLVQPYQFHTDIPDACIYNYSFALYPEEAQPSGSANFGRFESVTLVLTLQQGLESEDCKIIIFGRVLNLLKFRDGGSGLAFS